MSQNLKFIHLASGADAQHSSENIGAIIFEPKTGRVAVDGATGLEYYGGNIKNATFADQILTLSFNKGNDIKLDFSDTASASGVNAIMKAHADRIKALEDVVGNDSKGLVKDVAANKAAIEANKSAIDKINAADTGILAQAKKDTDGKLTALKGAYNGTLEGLDGRIASNATNITNLQRLHASDGANGKKTVEQEIIDKVGTGITGTVEAYVEGKVSTINETTAGLRTDVDDLEGRATALEGRATALEGRATALEGRATALEADVEANANAIAAINNETTGILAQAKSYTNDAKKAANDYTDGEVVKINTAADALKGRVTTLEGTVGKKAEGDSPATGLHKDIADLQALHATKNGAMMTVAAEAEAAAATAVANVVANAPENFDTLKEIADWIASDTTGSAQMANDIATLKTTVGDKDSGLVKDVADNTTNINNLKGLHVDGKTVAAEVTDGINKIAEHSETNVEGTDVVVTVTTKSGSVSGVTVSALGLRNDLGQKTAAASADTAFGRIKALETTVGEPAKGEVTATGLHKDIADNKSSIDSVRSDLGESSAVASADTAFGRIKALEEKQSSGTLMWSVWD